jgi:hypothetical protein
MITVATTQTGTSVQTIVLTVNDSRLPEDHGGSDGGDGGDGGLGGEDGGDGSDGGGGG